MPRVISQARLTARFGAVGLGPVFVQVLAIAAVVGPLVMERALAQAPPPAATLPAAPGAPAAPAAPELPGVIGQAPIAAGNAASARDRALDEAFRQLVERAFADLLAEAGTPTPSPAQASVRAAWLQRPRRLVRGYRVLEQTEQGGVLTVRVTADLDETGMRRELERARGTTPGPTRAAPGSLPVVAQSSPEAATALVGALTAKGMRAELVAGRYPDDDAVRALAQKSGRGLALAVSGRDEDEGLVRGASMRAHACEVVARLVPADGSPSDRSQRARAFEPPGRDARASCYARATAALLPTLLPEVGVGGGADVRTVFLDFDLTEPAVLTPLLRALRKLAGPAAAEVRRIAVGRVELGVNTRLAAPALLAGITRELASVATVTRTGADRGDRITAQIRLVPQTTPAAPGAGLGAPLPAPPPPAAGAAAAPAAVR